MVTAVQAGSLPAAATRLRRAARLPAPSSLPVSLVGDRLGPLVADADMDDPVLDALIRLAAAERADSPATNVSRGASPRSAASAADTSPRAVGQPSDDPLALGPRALADQRVSLGEDRTSAGLQIATRPRSARVSPEPPAHTYTQWFEAPRGHEGGASPRTGRVKPEERTGSLAHVRTALPQHAPGSVRVARDADTAALLQALVTPRAQLQPAPTSLDAAPQPPAAARRASTVGVPAPEVQDQPHDTSESPRGPFPVSPPVSAAPAPHQTSPAAEQRSEIGFVQTPVGLAGLASWWQEQSDPHRPTSAADWADAPRGSGPTHGPEGFEPWSTPVAQTADQLRETLEQLLLEEALADGLEVTDGPA